MSNYQFTCCVPNCHNVPFTRVTRSQMRLGRDVHWELRCRKHTPQWLREMVWQDIANAVRSSKTTLELDAWHTHGHAGQNIPKWLRVMIEQNARAAKEPQ